MKEHKQKEQSAGVKGDAGKPSLELLPPSYWCEAKSTLSHGMALWYFYGPQYGYEVLCNFGYDATRVLEFGRKKYAAHNWFKGMSWGRMVGAFHRHVNKFDEDRGLWLPRDLKEIDPESDLPHGEHAECCRVFLKEYSKSHIHLDVDIGENDCAWNQ